MPSSERQRSRRRTVKLFMGIIKMILQKPEKISVSQWAEKYRILDESSNFSGKWTHDVTPYLVGIMDAFNDPYIQEINFCKSTQVGGTEVMLNIIGWIIMEDQAPVMIVYPSDDLAKDISNDRIKPSLSKTPEIKERFYPNSSKELKLKFRGMTLYLRGSHSAEKLASKSIKYLFFDEIDKLDGASKFEQPVVGHIKSIEVELGLRVMDKEAFEMMGDNIDLTIRGVYQGLKTEDNKNTYTPVRIVMKGKNKRFEGGKLKIAEGTETKIKTELWYILIEIAGETMLELDKFNSKYNVCGKDMLAEVNRYC